jgi:hypothetical protein
MAPKESPSSKRMTWTVARRNGCRVLDSLKEISRDLVSNMVRRIFGLSFLLVLLGASQPAFAADDDPLFHSSNPLAPRDEWGRLHQMPNVTPTDYEYRSGSRWYYYFKSRHELLRDPAYVASLQTVLRNRGYYCGPIDGVMSNEVSDAIAKVQKNYVQRVDGHLTVPVRRALKLP